MNPRGLKYLGLVLLGLLLAAPARVLADEDELTPATAKKMVKAMDDNKTTLTGAISAAEANSKGKAVMAHCELKKDALVYGVYCVVGDKLMDIDVDGKTNKVVESKEVKQHTGKGEEEDEDEPDAATAKKMAKALDDNKITLAAAIATAEASSKGKAVLAHCELEVGKLILGVYCLAGEKLMDIDVDGKTNKVVESKEAGKHEGKHEEKSKKP